MGDPQHDRALGAPPPQRCMSRGQILQHRFAVTHCEQSWCHSRSYPKIRVGGACTGAATALGDNFHLHSLFWSYIVTHQPPAAPARLGSYWFCNNPSKILEVLKQAGLQAGLGGGGRTLTQQGPPPGCGLAKLPNRCLVRHPSQWGGNASGVPQPWGQSSTHHCSLRRSGAPLISDTTPGVGPLL